MVLNLHLQPWIAIAMLLFSSLRSTAQCSAPSTLWLVPPLTSTALVLKWTTAPGGTQYQLRYWENASPTDKTIVDNCGPAPFTLRGLRKNTAYTLQIRTKCGNVSSAWGNTINASTINTSGTCNTSPAGVVVTAGSSTIVIKWTSSGSHTIRYRLGGSGDWLIPPGAVSVQSAPFSIPGLSPGNYQVEIKRNCSATTSIYQRYTAIIDGPCLAPITPTIIPAATSVMVNLPAAADVTGYQVEYRQGTSGNWESGGTNIPPSVYLLTPPFLHSTTYQVQIQANCTFGISPFSAPATFTTDQEDGSCLANKHAGIDLDAGAIQQINQTLNTPSPFSFGSMIGVNDGGLVFRSFQNESYNQIAALTTQLRIFHTMDEDFNANPVDYALNIKPKNTIPEGTPAFTDRNKAFYSKYRETHGFGNITSATEILQYSPQTWKEKIYQESDWSLSGSAGIMQAYENYTKTFIDKFAPPNGVGTEILASNYQVGNELWDYPVKADYHSLLLGARNAFLIKYGPKSAGGWKMKLIAGAFQAYRAGNCTSILRDFSNCNSDLTRHDFIGDYLEVADCSLLKDLDGIDCHPYSFKAGTLTWTYPEDPESETWQIRNLAAWLLANQNSMTGVLQNTHLWSTEYGFDSDGVGEKTQSAYLLRGLLMHSRYHYEKVFFYNAYDVARPTDQYYSGLYNSSGFWRLGTHPANAAWASPIEAFGATPKPSWFGMLDFKARFGKHVFQKALVEDSEAFVLLIAKPDQTEPYLVFWSPQYTNDGNINQDIPLQKTIDWLGTFASNFTVDTTVAHVFAESNTPGQTFEAISDPLCGSLTLSTIRRNPSFIRLKSCQNVTNPGNGNRGSISPKQTDAAFKFSVAPNPGTDRLVLKYEGATVAQAHCRLVAATGQIMSARTISGLENQQQLEIDTQDLPPGIYFVCMQTAEDASWVIWERI